MQPSPCRAVPISSLLPLSVLPLPSFFRRYTIVLVFILFLGFINLIFGVKFSGAQNNAWIVSVAIGCVSGTGAPAVWDGVGFLCVCVCVCVCVCWVG